MSLYYHATSDANLSGILRDGLQPRDPSQTDSELDYQPTAIYLWRHYIAAVGYAIHGEVAAVTPQRWKSMAIFGTPVGHSLCTVLR
jgi:hypothetical protein